jgi:hypothetical protein
MFFFGGLLEEFMAHAEEESKDGRKEGRMHDSCAVFQKEKRKNTLVHICLLCFD